MLIVESAPVRQISSAPGSSTSPDSVVIVKWDRFYADVIRRLAKEACPHRETIMCHSGAEALALLRSCPAKLGLFGLTLPDMDGLDLLSIVTEERLAQRIMVVSGRKDERSRQVLRHIHVHGMFACGVETSDALVTAIRRVEAGGSYFSAVSGCGSEMVADRAELHRLLSVTELQVFAVIGGGCDDRQAGDRLGLSAKTVHWHRQRIMRKLDVQSRTELMVAAVQRGIVRITVDGVLRPGFERTLRARMPMQR